MGLGPMSRLTLQDSCYGQYEPSFLPMNIFVAEIIKMHEDGDALLSFVAEQYRSVLHNINIKEFISGVS